MQCTKESPHQRCIAPDMHPTKDIIYQRCTKIVQMASGRPLGSKFGQKCPKKRQRMAKKCHKTGISGHRLLRWLQMAGSQCMRSLEKREHGLVHIWCIVILARCTYSASLVNYIFCGMYVWCYASSVRWFFGALYLWYDASLVSCIIGVMHPCSNASFAGCIFVVMSLWWAAYMMQCIYGVLNLWCAASLFRCSFGVMSLLWFIYLLQYSFRCIASLVLCICTFGMLFIGIFGVPNRWCAATLVNYILVAIFLWCNVCIFGELHLWWIIFWLQYFFGVMYLRCIASLVLCICTFGMLCIGNFVGASLVWLLLCNASLVHCFLVLGAIYFWCCVFGAMHCQLYRAGLLPQWRIYFIIVKKVIIV